MSFRHIIEELQQNLEEIRKQNRLRRLRKLLKFLLIGFLIGRDSEKSISELATRNELIMDSLFKRFDDLKHSEESIKDFVDAFSHLIQIEEIVKDFGEELVDAQNRIFSLEDNLRKYRELVVSNTRRVIEQGENAIAKQVEEIANSGTYLIYDERQQCLQAIELHEEKLNYCDRSEALDEEYIAKRKEELTKSRQTILNYNNEFVQERKRDYTHLWNKGFLSLDDEQQTAVVTDDKHNLVVAAAGSGKTEVLITRIAYLIRRKPDSVDPRRILAIAYQRKAMEEIEKRLHDRYGIRNVSVRTFHKLGKDIVEETGKDFRHADIIDQNKKHGIIRKIFEQKIGDEPDYYKLFLNFVKTIQDKDEREDIEKKDEALIYALERSYFSINNTRVNSRAEKEILDFLLMHKLNGKSIGVKYEPDVNGFRPDFYLPQYDLFIEHWALNVKGQVPEWFSQSTKEYKKAMEKKKKWFADHDKSLVETFAHEYNEDAPEDFLELLKSRVIEKLQSRQEDTPEFILKTYKEIVEIAWHSYRTPIEDIVNFITSAKTYGLTLTRIAEKLRKNKWTNKQLAFGNLALPVYSVYEEILHEYDKIDFEDMINKAINQLNDSPSQRADVYDHILIDEYQDISSQRYKLIKKLMERNPSCKLFCVGDDWQSIMGFSGSNLNFFVNFEHYFENPAKTRISTNYRSIRTIVDAGAELIKNNTSCQIQKSTISNRKDVKLIKVLILTHKKDYEENYHRQTAEDCQNRIIDYIQKGYSPRDILILSRCMRTRMMKGYKLISNIRIFIEKAKEKGIKLAYQNVDAWNRIRLLTAHKSKGLEAKVVFLLNVTKGMLGFPCEMEDPSIYEPARENYPPQDTKEEERRLFYVAMTRAMEDLYIYTWEPKMSEFLEEIEDYTVKKPMSYYTSHIPKHTPEHQTHERNPQKTKTYTVEEIRLDYPKAYEKWTPEEDRVLTERYKEGVTVHQLAKMHQRKSGAIRSRLKKLGLL